MKLYWAGKKAYWAEHKFEEIGTPLAFFEPSHPVHQYVCCPFTPYGSEIIEGQPKFSLYPLECTVRETVMKTHLLPSLSDDALSVQILAKRLPVLARWTLNYAALRSQVDIEPEQALEEMRERFERLGKVLKPQSYAKALALAEDTVYAAYGFVKPEDPKERVEAIAGVFLPKAGRPRKVLA